jgi:hypothetical protein
MSCEFSKKASFTFNSFTHHLPSYDLGRPLSSQFQNFKGQLETIQTAIPTLVEVTWRRRATWIDYDMGSSGFLWKFRTTPSLLVRHHLPRLNVCLCIYVYIIYIYISNYTISYPILRRIYIELLLQPQKGTMFIQSAAARPKCATWNGTFVSPCWSKSFVPCT